MIEIRAVTYAEVRHYGTKAFVTLHPSALLRIREEADKQRAYRSFVDDLRLASQALGA